MTITVRLPSKLESDLRARAEAEGLPLSEFVRRALERTLTEQPEERPSAYELGKHLFGKYGSGRSDLSTNRKKIIREALRAKHRR